MVDRTIAKTEGQKSQDRKIGIIKKMLVACQDNEAKYLIRALQGKLRIGLAEQTVLVAIAQAFILTPPIAVKRIMKQDKRAVGEAEAEAEESKEQPDSDEEEYVVPASYCSYVSLILILFGSRNVHCSLPEPPLAQELREGVANRMTNEAQIELGVALVKQAFSECPNYNKLVDAMLREPVYRLYRTCRLTPGIPVAPMLAKPTKSFAEVLKRMSGVLFTCEYK